MSLRKPRNYFWRYILIALIVGVGFGYLTFAKNPKHKKHEKQDTSNIPIPQDQEVCFSPDEACDLKLLKLLQNAKKSIDCAIYDINRDSIVQYLIIASKSISVRVITDQRQAKGPHSFVGLLIKSGVQVRFGRQRGTMHHKFMIVDGKVLETGSFDYTNHASESNRENQVYLTQSAIVEKYKKHFDLLWSNGVPAQEKEL